MQLGYMLKRFLVIWFYNQIIRKRTAMNFIVSEMIIMCKKKMKYPTCF